VRTDGSGDGADVQSVLGGEVPAEEEAEVGGGD
jgi:hypothetical protein